MQFQIAALTLALAVGASAASVDRMTKVVKKADAKVTVETFNFSTCNPEASAATFELNEIGDCVTFEQGYGSASYTATEDAGPVLLAVFEGKECSGSVKVTGPNGCAENTNGEPIWSAALIQDPTGHA